MTDLRERIADIVAMAIRAESDWSHNFSMTEHASQEYADRILALVRPTSGERIEGWAQCWDDGVWTFQNLRKPRKDATLWRKATLICDSDIIHEDDCEEG